MCCFEDDIGEKRGEMRVLKYNAGKPKVFGLTNAAFC